MELQIELKFFESVGIEDQRSFSGLLARAKKYIQYKE